MLTLGPAGFFEHVRDLARFLRSGGQGDAGTTVLQKLGTLADSWSLPWVLAVVGAVLAVALATVGVVLRWRSTDPADRVVIATALAAAVGALAFIAWWATASRLPLWVRHPAPGVYAFFPVIAAVAVWAVLRLPRTGAARAAGIVAVTGLALTVAGGAALHVASDFAPRPLTLDQQRASVVPIQEWAAENDVEWLAADPWGAAVAPIVLSGVHVGLFDAPAMAGVPRLTGLACTTEILVDGGLYRVCAAP